MSPRLLPSRQSVSADPDEHRHLSLDDDQTATVFDALSTETARDLFRCLCREPMTTSDVAGAIGTSVQNANYHLDKLRAAGLIDVVDTWYSCRGNEMRVYAARSRSITIECARSG